MNLVRASFPLYSFFLSAILLCAPVAESLGEPAEVASQTETPLPVFEFHSGFWINLHHFLYQQARLPSEARATRTLAPPLSPAETQQWQAALDYYAANLAGQDLLNNRDMAQIKDRLAELETEANLASSGLRPELIQSLEDAAPVYRARWWPQHDRTNRTWIAAVAPLVRQHGRFVAEQLAEVYREAWPRGLIRVDVCYQANWAGAYTTLDPLRVTISSSSPNNQGRGAFEVLFHEASHSLAGGAQNAIVKECRRLGKPIPRDLWHALLFYTTGEVVRRVLLEPEPVAGKLGPASSSKPQPYTPYAYRLGLYERGWQSYRRFLERFWQPYLDGKTDFDSAIARLVSAL